MSECDTGEFLTWPQCCVTDKTWRGGGWRSQMFCSGEECISGESYGGRCRLAPGTLLRQGGIKPISLPPSVLFQGPQHSYILLHWQPDFLGGTPLGSSSNLELLSKAPKCLSHMFVSLSPINSANCGRKGATKGSVHNIYSSHFEVKSALAR